MGEETGKLSRCSDLLISSLSLHDFLQSVVRREFDEDTGRVRLIKGDGEVLEECVSRLDHFD